MEGVLECPKEYSELAKKALSDCMIKGGNYYLTNLNIQADASIGCSWYEAK